MLSTAADMPGPLHITLIGESFSIYHIYLLINLPAADTNSCSVYFMNRTHTHTHTHISQQHEPVKMFLQLVNLLRL